MAFEPVNELEKLLISASADPAARPAFTQALLTSELFAITEGKGNEGRRIAEEGSRLSLRGFEYEGKPHTAIFTSLQRLQAALQEEAGYVAINGRDLLNVMRGHHLYLN